MHEEDDQWQHEVRVVRMKLIVKVVERSNRSVPRYGSCNAAKQYHKKHNVEAVLRLAGLAKRHLVFFVHTLNELALFFLVLFEQVRTIFHLHCSIFKRNF